MSGPVSVVDAKAHDVVLAAAASQLSAGPAHTLPAGRARLLDANDQADHGVAATLAENRPVVRRADLDLVEAIVTPATTSDQNHDPKIREGEWTESIDAAHSLTPQSGQLSPTSHEK